EGLQRLGSEGLAQAGKGLAGPFLARVGVGVVERHPAEPADPDLAAQPPQPDILLAQPVLVALLLARDVDAVPLHVELPGMEHAGHPLRVARRLALEEAARRPALDQHAPVRADVEEGADLVVGAAADDDRLAGDRRRPGVVGLRQLRLVADRDPGLLEDPLELLLEDLRVRVETAVDPLAALEGRIGLPLAMVSGRHRLVSSDSCDDRPRKGSQATPRGTAPCSRWLNQPSPLPANA